MIELEGASLGVIWAALAIGVTHTLLGPDHYLPFLMLARVRKWSWARTLTITAACGVGHVAGSIALGAIGLALGAAVGELELIEGLRGDWAAWALFAFGLAYAAWGLRHALRNRKELTPHEHEGDVHIHHHGGGAHCHDPHQITRQTTFWALFIIFVLGPCESLIPLFMLPASTGEWSTAWVAALAYGVATVTTMVVVTALGLAGLNRIPLGGLERYSHAMAGVMVAASGGAVLFLGL
ncbi:hypothetical protein KAI87_12185 [Myxococcota bacterium]|nr:hypothetical protein [Myxococcota bacterium]